MGLRVNLEMTLYGTREELSIQNSWKTSQNATEAAQLPASFQTQWHRAGNLMEGKAMSLI